MGSAKRLCLVLGVLLPILAGAQVTTLHYEITAKGKKIGEMQVRETWKGKLRMVEVNSETKVRFIISISVETALQAVYQDGQLRYSIASSHEAGRLRARTSTRWETGHYVISTEEEKFRVDAPITFSGALLYLQEPKNLHALYSEIDGYMKEVSMIGPAQYRVTNPRDGQKTEYQYENGVLQALTVYHRIMPFSMRLKHQE